MSLSQVSYADNTLQQYIQSQYQPPPLMRDWYIPVIHDGRTGFIMCQTRICFTRFITSCQLGHGWKCLPKHVVWTFDVEHDGMLNRHCANQGEAATLKRNQPGRQEAQRHKDSVSTYRNAWYRRSLHSDDRTDRALKGDLSWLAKPAPPFIVPCNATPRQCLPAKGSTAAAERKSKRKRAANHSHWMAQRQFALWF